MPTVQFKLIRAWMGACVFAGALSAIAANAEEEAKTVLKPASKTVTIQSSRGVGAGPKVIAAKSVATRTPAAKAGSGRMQVEEPKASAPVSDARASKEWQKTHAKGLTEEQKKAFRDRKEGMETLITVIKAKRKALHDAKPEERAALTRELHSLILEKDESGAATAAARVEVSAGAAGKETKAANSAPALDKDADRAARREEYRRQQLEKMKQWKAKAQEED